MTLLFVHGSRGKQIPVCFEPCTWNFTLYGYAGAELFMIPSLMAIIAKQSSMTHKLTLKKNRIPFITRRARVSSVLGSEHANRPAIAG